MARLLPFRPTPEVRREPRLVELDDEAADAVFAALSSDTARAILGRLYEDPTTASEVAEAVDTSLQNARYHLDKLQSAGLVEVVDTWYSSRGTEMAVYAPTNEPLVVAAGPEESAGVLREALARVLGAVGVLALASLLVDRFVRLFGPTPTAGAMARGGEFQDQAAELTPEADATANVSGGAGAAGGGAAPSPTSVAAATTTPADTSTAAGATPTPVATGTPSPTPAPAATATPEAVAQTEVVTRTVVREREIANATAEATRAAADGGAIEALPSTIPPGLLFFAGGLAVLVLAAGWWYWSRYRPLYG